MEEDLLLGIESKIGRKHFFFADLDDKDWEKAKEKCKRLVEKYFDRVWLLFSGNGFHIVSFEPISLSKLIKINEEIKADEKFIIYIKRMKKAVLRLSRKSEHAWVPRLVAIFFKKRKPLNFWEKLYLKMLKVEDKIYRVERLVV